MISIGWILLVGMQISLNLDTLSATTVASGIDLPGMIEAVSQTSPMSADSAPQTGTFYSAQNPNGPPFPGNINDLDVWSLGDGIYVLDDLNFDYQIQFESHSMLRGFGRGGFSPDGEPDGGSSAFYTFNTNGLWLAITNVAKGAAYLNLNNATNEVYAIWCTTNCDCSRPHFIRSYFWRTTV
jgi:hypothetical protein